MPLPEVRGDGLVLVATIGVACGRDSILNLANLRARIPLTAAPRVRLPTPRDFVRVEESLDDVVAAVRAGAREADHGDDAVEVRIDRSLIAGRGVEVDAEINRAARGNSVAVRLRVSGLRIRDALAITVQRGGRRIFPVRDDVDARGPKCFRLGRGKIFSRRVVAQVATRERVAARLSNRSATDAPTSSRRLSR